MFFPDGRSGQIIDVKFYDTVAVLDEQCTEDVMYLLQCLAGDPNISPSEVKDAREQTLQYIWSMQR